MRDLSGILSHHECLLAIHALEEGDLRRVKGLLINGRLKTALIAHFLRMIVVITRTLKINRV
jgi:hypothetical protein